MIRLKVYSMRAYTPIGRGWVYEVYDTAGPDGFRGLVSGTRLTWASALADGLKALRSKR